MTGEPADNSDVIRVLIADDHALVRNGLRLTVEDEPGMVVVGEAEDGLSALALTNELRPDVLLLDLTMPALDGLEVARRLRDADMKVHVLMLTMHEDSGLVREALAVGVAGYLVKRAAAYDLIDAIRSVAAGECYIHPSLQGWRSR